MIARTWRGVTTAEDRDRYVDVLRRTGLAGYASAEGHRGALVLRRTEGERTEFLLVSLWDSEDSVRAFAGERPERAVFYPEDDRFLVEADRRVDHYEVVEASEAPPEPRARRAGDLQARGWKIAGFR